MTLAHSPPGHRALRRGRFSEAGRIYFVTTVADRRRRLFADFDIACPVSRLHLDPTVFGGARCLAWVLMPDHWHGLIELAVGQDLSRAVQRFKSRSAFVVNRQRSGVGAVWARGFHDQALRADEDVRRAARYLIANPIRAGLVRSVGAYPFWDAVWL